MNRGCLVASCLAILCWLVICSFVVMLLAGGSR